MFRKKPRGARKITVWEIQHEKESVAITVYLTQGSWGVSRDELKVYAYCEKFNFSVESTDLTDLYDKATAKLQEFGTYEWKTAIYVAFGGGSKSDEGYNVTEISFFYDACLIAFDEKMQLITKHAGDLSHSKAKPTGEVVINGNYVRTGTRDKTDKYSSKINGVAGFVDDTPENRAALEKIRNGFDLLKDRIEKLLNPEKLQDALTMIVVNDQLLLPSANK